MNTVVTFDTLAYANKLKSVNIPAEQAEAMRDILEAAFHTRAIALCLKAPLPPGEGLGRGFGKRSK